LFLTEGLPGKGEKSNLKSMKKCVDFSLKFMSVFRTVRDSKEDIFSQPVWNIFVKGAGTCNG